MRTCYCEDMKYYTSFKCNVHENPFDCPDQIVYCDKDGREFGIIIHDGGSSVIAIQYCP